MASPRTAFSAPRDAADRTQMALKPPLTRTLIRSTLFGIIEFAPKRTPSPLPPGVSAKL